uniref:Acrosin-binding protein n=1 Tax=Naja naja TaxID=35670 RepID=A0A8C7E427_NAJNA
LENVALSCSPPQLIYFLSCAVFPSGFPIFLTPAIQSSLSSDPGSPLTDDEYKVFFSSLSPTWKANLVCQIRRNKGCHDPKIIELDQFENHGQIPEGMWYTFQISSSTFCDKSCWYHSISPI